MPVSTTAVSETYNGNGSTVAFPVPFPFPDDDDLVITLTSVGGTQTVLTKGTHYTVAGAAAASGTVTMLTAPATGETLSIERVLSITQPYDPRAQGSFSAPALATALDRQTLISQQVDATLENLIDTGLATQSYVNGLIASGDSVVPDFWNFTGNGVTTDFSIPGVEVSDPLLFLVAVNGLTKRPTTDYTVSASGELITFVTAPAAASVIHVRQLAYASAQTLADNTSVTAAGATASRTLTSRFSDVLNAKDFGAACDGVTDDTAAIQRAIDYFAGYAGVVELPGGCVISDTLNIFRSSVTLRGRGWGRSNTAPRVGFLKWAGVAGIPMVKIADGFGAGVERLRFIGNSAAKPLAAVELSQLNPSTGTHACSVLRDLWIGKFYGLDADNVNQFTNGLIFTGTTNGDSNTLNHIRITGCDSCGIDVQNGNATDMHLDGIFIQETAVAIKTKATLVGTNILCTNSTTADIQLEAGGKCIFNSFISESSGRLCVFNGSAAKLHLVGGGWQAQNAKINADGRIIDTATFLSCVVILDGFSLQYQSPYTGPKPTIRAYNTGGGASNAFVRITGTWGIYPANLELGTMVGRNDARTIIYEPAQESGQDPMPRQALHLNYDLAEDRSFQVWRNDFAGKLNLFGGDLNVRKLVKPANVTASALLGSGATVYSYRVTALTYAGETDASTAATVSNNAVLSVSAVNRVTWNPVAGAYAYKVYGRTGGTELLLKTLLWSDDLHPGSLNNVTPPRWDDNGSLVPGGTLPEYNTTGNMTVEGYLTGKPFVHVLTTLTYSAAIDIDASVGNSFQVTATNGVAFTINNPTNARTGQRMKLTIRNTSGGALGAITWDTLFKMAAWVSPATANSRSIEFEYNGTNWREIGKTAADVPN